MRYYTAAIFFWFIGIHSASTQQVGYNSQINETQAFWNPASTASSTYMYADAFFRQQWVGFSGAPRTTYASFMYPLLDYNMSVGGFVFNDQTGPVGKTGIKANYAYKLKGVFGDDAILSIGISGTMQQFGFNSSGETFNDDGDVLIQGGKNTVFFPSLGAGVYYNSHPEEYDRGANSFYVGLAYNHAYSSNVLIGDASFERQKHMYLLIGGKIMSYSSYIEPSFSANYVKPDLIDYMLSIKYEKEATFWTGLGYSSVSDVSVQGGWIIDRFMGNRYAKLRLGTLANFSVSQYGSKQGPGFEMFVRYEVNLD